MNLKSLGLTFGAAIAAFLVVGIAVTELVSHRIEFSLFVGIPAGLIAGAIVGGLVAMGLRDDAPAERRRSARSFAVFGIAFLAVLFIGSLANIGTVFSILAGVIVGVFAGIGTFLRGANPPDPRITA